MTNTRKTRVAVIYGGRSSEHEISRQSAAFVIEHLDRERFEPVPIAIDRDGTWHAQDLALLTDHQGPALPIDREGASAILTAEPAGMVKRTDEATIDVVLPMLHGPLCEDGSVQGLLELADLPYVGTGVLGSAVCMDKDVAKRLIRADGMDTVAYRTFRPRQWYADADTMRAHLVDELGYPMFVKPANMGSSVGITRVGGEAELDPAVELAFQYDDKIIVEKAVNAREIELAVLSPVQDGDPPEVSLPGEIEAQEAFYSFERKYEDAQGAALHVPADLTNEQVARCQDMARRAFQVLECDGMARIDLFLDRDSGHFLFNEANTIPGFTNISMYPRLWQASGLPYSALLSRLIDHAVQRHERRSRLRRDK